jgi:hypothetical protein
VDVRWYEIFSASAIVCYLSYIDVIPLIKSAHSTNLQHLKAIRFYDGYKPVGSHAATSLACDMKLYVVATKRNKMHTYKENLSVWAKVTDVAHGPLVLFASLYRI